MEETTVETVPFTEAFSNFSSTVNHEHNGFFFVVSVIVSAAVLPGNLLTLIAFVKDRELQTPSNYLIFNQSAIDALSAPLNVFQAFIKYHLTGAEIVKHKYFCLCFLVSVPYLKFLSATNILTISLQRMIFVIRPHSPKSPRLRGITLTVIFIKHLILMAFFSLPLLGMNHWQLGIPCTIASVFYQEYSGIGFLILLMSMFGIVATNMITYHRYKKQRRLIGSENYLGNLSKDWRLTMMLVIVSTNFLASWVPLFVLYLARQILPSSKKNKHFLLAIELAWLLNTAIGITNPFIYAGKSPKFKLAFKKILHLN